MLDGIEGKVSLGRLAEVCLRGDRLVGGENGDETGREMDVEERMFQKKGLLVR